MPDTIASYALCLIFLVILAAWITLDTLERRRWKRRIITNVLDLSRSIVAHLEAGECAKVWHDDVNGFHICARQFEHKGPCYCPICEDVQR